MRVRNNPKALGIIQQYDDIVLFRPEKHKGKWKEFMTWKNDSKPDVPIHAELGMGRGKFISTMGLLNKGIGFIGIDLRYEIILSALEKVLERELRNVLLLPYNILNLGDVFEISEVDCFYINFCDPWPKVRHSKRRLTHRLFLEKYRTLLKDGGRVEFKTDSRELFDFSINEFRESGFEIVDLTYDLQSGNYPGNITTEYEEKFINNGIKINRLEAVKR
ncbi:MAG TPA: tRNA (guanosine(46)-N7)-methyltransferase TrmB [Bacillota bacterium]|nr:tRNA (guanosine(46)-N7)-methyltransferase TrmB [Bacillota bacterium]HPL52716.1 tRNA (guanosine(46)-N7)-methyltransferase TrmB [Bacillota bacterium]